MHLTARQVTSTLITMILASCARNSSTGAPANTGSAAPTSVATMSAHGSVRLALSTPNAQVDFDKATCSLALPSDGNGGLRITATSSAVPGSSVVIVGSSVARDGDTTWTPDGTPQRSGAPMQINVRLPDGVIFSGATGGTTTLHVQGGGRSGTATFQGGTYVSHTTVTDAAGTVSWSCS